MAFTSFTVRPAQEALLTPADIVDKPWQRRDAADLADAVTHSWWWTTWDEMSQSATGRAARAIAAIRLPTA